MGTKCENTIETVSSWQLLAVGHVLSSAAAATAAAAAVAATATAWSVLQLLKLLLGQLERLLIWQQSTFGRLFD
jgi:hypothetical protein